MKKLYSFLTGIVLVILVLWGISNQIEASMNTKNSDKLVIYNWGDYIDPDLLKEFTKETGIQVQYDTFDSNEAMYTKIKQGGTTYDIAIPSEYMIAKMMDEHLVEKLDQSKIKGMENIDPKLLTNRLIRATNIQSLTSGVPWGLSTIPRWSKMLLNIGQISGVKSTEMTS